MKASDLIRITELMNSTRDIDVLLERLLYEARCITKADAGSIYLREGDTLEFKHVQNDTLSRLDPNANRHIYAKQAVAISEKSIAGYVALTGQCVCIPDVYKLDSSLPYSFNRSFDERSNYRTKSILTAPLITEQEEIVGVMQLLNARDKNGKVRPFSKAAVMDINILAANALVALKRAGELRELIDRMNRLAELRDPKETGNHVNRVSAYAVEIYQSWAKNHGYTDEEVMQGKDMLKIAAKLHDVGKVAISDQILKKPGKLTDEEYADMKGHTTQGASLFKKLVTEWDGPASEVALRHHERWDGGGYPGNIVTDDQSSASDADLHVKGNTAGVKFKGLKGEEIPIYGRIVALADVYDALISKRAYKEEWNEATVLDYIREQSGKQFDPEVVDAFIAKYEIVCAIRNRYADADAE